ncbi:PDDEXK family nuclease [Bacillus amyloliquefaciens]|uniref:hypothetical protein n=1 Tax=Bacillus amyloliquefaciens TaxID=1390 RepID=UPI00384D3D1F
MTRSGLIDAVKISNNDIFAVEWETGNIASSHRTLNKITTGILTTFNRRRTNTSFQRDVYSSNR